MRVIGLVAPEICTMIKTFSEKLKAQSKISCQYTCLLHGNSVVVFFNCKQAQ